MTRSDLLVQLVKAGVMNNQTAFRDLVETLIAEERSKEHHVLARQLEENLRTIGSYSRSTIVNNPDERIHAYLNHVLPRKRLDELRLQESIKDAVMKLVKEQHRRELLHSYALEPRNKILLTGPPGNGKSSLAEAIADSLMVPLFVVRYEGIIGSYLGETSSRLSKLFEYVRTRPCVLFFDEFDTIGKERGDVHETGEIKRVVSGLLMQIDALPSHVVIVTATNHPELLDRAAWRRFQLQLHLAPPTEDDIFSWLQEFEDRMGENFSAKLLNTVARRLSGASFAELEEFCLNVQRTWVLSIPDGNIRTIIMSCLKELELAAVSSKKHGE